MNEITVQVSGLTGTGKSTIISLINQVLLAAGLETKLTNDCNEQPISLEAAQRNLKNLKGKTVVKIGETYQARCPGSDAKCLPGGASLYPAFKPITVLDTRDIQAFGGQVKYDKSVITFVDREAAKMARLVKFNNPSMKTVDSGKTNEEHVADWVEAGKQMDAITEKVREAERAYENAAPDKDYDRAMKGI